MTTWWWFYFLLDLFPAEDYLKRRIDREEYNIRLYKKIADGKLRYSNYFKEPTTRDPIYSIDNIRR